MLSHNKAGTQTLQCITVLVLGLHPSPLHHTFLTKLPRGVGEELGDGDHPG